ncbi:S-formylglutathione hydrolase [Rhodobacter sp. KR11]|uniref:S-formylglutathione hydrolase n=1 Tax=Rhodobacter sp. KR11 TaxID=2974588 RepID=UPI0022216BF3|nr:S-formylglutathione hydrolase [Rhodobacter sp. KR11]MCW1919266.1 S-formylglutathione hydrolase [Rhodobacter sp. KR11]
MKVLAENKAFGGRQLVVSHPSAACDCEMTFGLYLPPGEGPFPVLWYLSGLTCTHENAMVKAGAQAWAAREGIALVFPDTSPRGPGVADDAAYDLGQGAGFYVDATQAPWAAQFQMWTYVTAELPAVLADFPLDLTRQAITGHSMGGHGALTIAATFPDRFRSVSAFAPICNPTGSDWGRKQFAAYLGTEDVSAHDASLLWAKGVDLPLLVDQGQADKFLDLLKTETLEAVAGPRATIRRQEGYDHSYFFVSTFIEDHVVFHARALKA